MGARKILKSSYFFIVVVTVATLAVVSALDHFMPGLSAVESGSMQHSDTWTPGVINTGDLVFQVKVANPVQDITTYVQGRSGNFSTYGDYGNVIIYDAPGNISIIHRAMFYLEWNGTNPVVAGYNGQPWITVSGDYILIQDVGYSHRNLVVSVGLFEGKEGFITMGDNNLATSQMISPHLDGYIAADQDIFGFDPVIPAHVLGVSWGHIPWAGLIKLNILRVQGQWAYYDDVPQYSYLYLALSAAFLTGALAAMAHVLNRFERKKKKRVG